MSKTQLIIAREYLSRVKKKSFIIMSIIGPILIAGLVIVPTYLATQDEDLQEVEVIDETGLFINQLKNTDKINFHYEFRSLAEAKQALNEGSEFTAVLHIPEVVVSLPNTVQLFYKSSPKRSSIDYMENQIAKVIENKKLEDKYNLSLDQISGLRPDVDIVSSKIDESGEAQKSAGALASGVGFMLSFFIYMFIFIFGVQVMRGVIEEKTNRIVEVIISSVKPFQLMMGKIVGIALVAITQFLIWVILSGIIIIGVQSAFADELKASKKAETEMVEGFNPAQANAQLEDKTFVQKLNEKLSMINFPLVLGCFLFYFIGGYLLYGSLFAAIGSAVDSETDTQQFMLPVTIPLILAIVFAQSVMENPDGTLAFWTSIIPFTSPIIMMIRIPGGVPWEEVALSMALLTGMFIFTTWLAARIYRTGILMYGKKITFKEMGKWIFIK
jgi:ABC-2 type transport system permease protein